MVIRNLTKAEFNVYKTQVDEQLSSIAIQLQSLRFQPQEILTAEIAKVSFFLNERLDQLAQQLATFRSSLNIQDDGRKVEVLRNDVDSKMSNISIQIAQLRNEISLLGEGDTPAITDLELQNIITTLQEYIDTLVVNMINIPHYIIATEFDYSITTPGDSWTGTTTNDDILSTSKIFTELKVKSVTTRHLLRPTNFIFHITNIANKSFTWGLESEARVLDAEITVMYTWSK